MPRFSVLPFLLLIALLAGCGSGGTPQSPSQSDPAAFKIVLINCLPGRTLDFWDSDVTEPSNSPNYFGTIEDEMATPEGFAQILDPVQVQSVLASATPIAHFESVLHLLGGGSGSPITIDLDVEHGLGDLYLKLVPNPQPGGDTYVAQVITEAEFEQMLSDGSIQGVLGL